jgi:poly-gamma-glutamate system protein
MKRLYWRPRAVSRTALALIAVISIAGLFAVERTRTRQKAPHYDQKLEAAQLAHKALGVIKEGLLDPSRTGADSFSEGTLIDPETDPMESGLIGLYMTPVTTVAGDLRAKQRSINPNFAAIVVDMLKEAGVGEGDVVAVGCSGSFPAINTSVYAALETLKTRPIIIASASASQWGANRPDYMWIDMEKRLFDAKVFSFKSVAASIGGIEDRGVGMPEAAKAAVTSGIDRNSLIILEGESFSTAIAERMKNYKEKAGGPIKAYINIGGGTVSVGRSIGKKTYHPGLNLQPPRGIANIEGVMPEFTKLGIPVIHLVQIAALSERYGLASLEENDPDALPSTRIPEPGEGGVFYREDYRRWLVIAVLVTILGGLYAFIRSDVGFRIFRPKQQDKSGAKLEPMV